jgi:hypothetical protein
MAGSAWKNSKNLTPEELKKRQDTNKKVMKFGCLPITIILIIVFIISLSSGDDESESTKKASFDPVEFNDPLNIGLDSIKKYEGKKVPFENWSEWGSPETLEGTSNIYWSIYLDKANVSMVSIKESDKVVFASFEKETAGKYLKKLKNDRKELVESQLSGWDGSHPGLTKMIKKNMNDPDSYEHVETKYRDEGQSIFIITKFRGKNAFGGKVMNTISARVDFNGNVIEIVE